MMPASERPANGVSMPLVRFRARQSCQDYPPRWSEWRYVVEAVEVPEPITVARRVPSERVLPSAVRVQRMMLSGVRARGDPGAGRFRAGPPGGVIDILVAREPAEHRLPKQRAQLMACVLAAAAVEELRDRHVGKPERVIQLAVGEQAAVGCDPGAVNSSLIRRSKVGLRGGSLASPVAYPTIPSIPRRQHYDSNTKIGL